MSLRDDLERLVTTWQSVGNRALTNDPQATWAKERLDAETLAYAQMAMELRLVLNRWANEALPRLGVPIAALIAAVAAAAEPDGPGEGDTLRVSIAKLIQSYNQTGEPKLPPNPHRHGTYDWAREEHRRGATVEVVLSNGDSHRVMPAAVWDACQFTHAAFVATNWTKPIKGLP